MSRRILLLLILISLTACSKGLELKNVLPRVATLGPVTKVSDDRVEIQFSLQDHEGDPIDVELVYIDANGTETPLEPGYGGHGTNGLSSNPTQDGQTHLFVWDISKVAVSGPIRLKLLPNDGFGDGLPVTSEEFTLDAGLPGPIRLPFIFPN